MASTLPTEADLAFLTALAGPAGVNLTVRLFTNPVTPSAGDNVSTYTEADYSGYAPYNGPGWTAPATDPTGASWIMAPALTFTQTGNAVVNTVYGYYITVMVGTDEFLLDAQRFPVALSMDGAGKTAPCQPVIVHQAAV